MRLSYLNDIHISTHSKASISPSLYTVNYNDFAKLLCELNEKTYVEAFSTVNDIH